MASSATPNANQTQEPDSPRASPVPTGVHGDLELELMALANALYNLGTTVINDSSKDGNQPGGGKPVGSRVNEVIQYLHSVDNLARTPDLNTMIPIQVLLDIDNAKNPMQLTRERLERAATENQFMNGKIEAVQTYHSYLNQALSENFPEMTEHV
ncbi:hypothetical protein VKT23_005192 [Stygiomarasmius scandens]|uniref:Mediator of RNA polymerase II transcription subunit 10 n=1 Tax=Marasmiellus scandens TaxID=2682957 RepID=A0ABR1JVN7_9AGAR